MEDKVLPDNKTSINLDIEREIIDSLASLYTEINQDDSQPEGIGSLAMATLGIKTLLSQRDKINKLSYEINVLKSNLESLKSNLELLKTKNG